MGRGGGGKPVSPEEIKLTSRKETVLLEVERELNVALRARGDGREGGWASLPKGFPVGYRTVPAGGTTGSVGQG